MSIDESMPDDFGSADRTILGAVSAVLIVLCNSAPSFADDLPVFENGAAAAPFNLYVGDKSNWALPLGDAAQTSVAGVVSVVARTESGNIDASWNGRGEGQLYLGTADAIDLTGLVENDAALVVLMKVSSAPNKRVTMRMGCEYPCAANAPVMKLFKALPEDRWIRVSFDLKCFADNGLDATIVDTPFLLTTRGKMSMSIADIRFVGGAGPGATIKCR